MALAIFLTMMALLSIYFFVTLEDNQETLEKRGYHALEKLGEGMKQKDAICSTIITNRASDKKAKTGSSPSFSWGSGPITASLKSDRTNEPDAIYYTFDSTNRKKTDSVHILLKEFITPLLRWDFFSDFIFIRNKRIMFSTLPGDIQLSDAVSLPKKEKATESDPAFNLIPGAQESKFTPFGIQTGSIEKITIHGTNYLLFLIPVNFHGYPDCFLGGFIQEKKFIRDKRSLPSDLIVVFIFTLLLIVVSFPILKVFIMGPREKLTRTGVTMIGISLVTGTLLLVIMLSQQLISYRFQTDQYDQLRILNKTVQKAFTNERDTALKQLDWYNAGNIAFGKETKKHTSILDSDTAANPLLKKPVYLFYKTVFWADETGTQRTIITPYQKYFPSSVNEREYFIHPDKYELNTVRYNMVPIYSQTSGEWAIAFSTPSKNDSARIVALTTSMYSLKWPVLQYGFEYCLVDKTGKVWYHSNEIMNINDSLITESHENKTLISALTSNECDSMELEIRNRNYLAYISPVDNSDLFVVSLLNTARAKSIGALTAMFVFCFFALIFLILFLIYIAIIVWRTKKSKLAGKEYFFKWLLPGKQNNKTYWQLIIFNGAGFIILLGLEICGLFDGLSLAMLIVILVLFMVAHCTLTYRVLTFRIWHGYDKHFKKMPQDVPYYTIFVMSWLLTIVIMPVVLTTSAFFSAETTNFLQRQQQFLAHQINERTETIHQFYKENLTSGKSEAFSGSGDSLFRARNSKGLYFMNIDRTQFQQNISPHTVNHVRGNQPVLKAARSWFDRVMNESEPISTDPMIGSLFPATGDTCVSLIFDRLDYNDQGKKTETKSMITTRNQWSGFFNPFRALPGSVYAFLFWVLIVAMLVLIGFLVNRLVRKLFFSCESECVPVPLFQELDTIAKARVNAIIISYHDPEIEELGNREWECIDMAEVSISADTPVDERRVLYNLEPGIESLLNFRNRIQFLEKQLKKRPVILWMDKTPERLVATYKDGWDKQKEHGESATQISQFNRLIFGIPFIYPEIQQPETEGPWLCEKLSAILEAEKRFNPEVQRYHLLIKGKIKRCCENTTSNVHDIKGMEPICSAVAEDLILKIQELSTSFYDYVWGSLSEDEQFLLLDLAQDTLLNLKNKKTITLLFKKGILHRKERIEIVSPSFKNYILTEIDKTSFETMQKKIDEEGTWHRFKVPLILIATSLMVFLFVTQQNFLSGLNTILVSAGALVGVYLRFSGLFSKSKGT